MPKQHILPQNNIVRSVIATSHFSYQFCLRVTAAVINTTTKATRVGKVYLSSVFILLLIIEGDQDRTQTGRKLKAGADTEAVEECFLLACSP